MAVTIPPTTMVHVARENREWECEYCDAMNMSTIMRCDNCGAPKKKNTTQLARAGVVHMSPDEDSQEARKVRSEHGKKKFRPKYILM